MRVHVCVHMNVHQMPKAKATGLIEGYSGIVIDRKRQRRQVVCCSVCVRESHSGVMTPHGSRTRGWDSLLTPCCQLRGGIKEEEEEEEWWRWKRRRWWRQLPAPQDSNWLAERMTHTHTTHTRNLGPHGCWTHYPKSTMAHPTWHKPPKPHTHRGLLLAPSRAFRKRRKEGVRRGEVGLFSVTPPVTSQ